MTVQIWLQKNLYLTCRESTIFTIASIGLVLGRFVCPHFRLCFWGTVDYHCFVGAKVQRPNSVVFSTAGGKHGPDLHKQSLAKHARNSRKVQEDRVTWSLQCSEIDSDCFEMFESQLGNPRIWLFKFLSVICFGTTKCSWNRSHPRGCFKCFSLLACRSTVFNLFSN